MEQPPVNNLPREVGQLIWLVRSSYWGKHK
jgi:hypothetical protein